MLQTQLPPWRSVLAVVAHPDDESFALGAVLAAFAEAGAQVSVLCLTRGEASTLHGVAGDLTDLRAEELTAAAAVLGLRDVALLAYSDGGLPGIDLDQLAVEVVTAARRVGADGILGFNLTGVAGHPDHAHATAAAIRAAKTLDLPVLGWTVPDTIAEKLRNEHGAPHRTARRQRASAVAPGTPDRGAMSEPEPTPSTLGTGKRQGVAP